MKKKRQRHFIAALLPAVLLAAVLLTGLPALAGETAFAAAAQPALAEADIPVRYVSDGETAHIRLIAETPETPMPSGVTGGVRDLVLRGTASATFGKILYQRPDIYHYTVRRSGDDAVYRVNVIARSDGQANVVITKDGRAGKCALVFRDKTEEETAAAGQKTGSPGTGDPFPLTLWALMYLSAAAVMFSYILACRRSRKQVLRAGLWLMVLLMGASFASPEPASGSTKKIKAEMHRWGNCSVCSDKRNDGKNDWKVIYYDDRTGNTTYRWVSFKDPDTGKTKKADAFCLQPTSHSPGYGKKTAAPIDTDGSKRERQLSKVLYFADGGPGEAEFRKYLEKHKGTYPDAQSGKARFGFMHILLSYTYRGSSAFDVNSTSGDPSRAVRGQLSPSFQKQIKKAYQWCLDNARFVTDPEFRLEPAKAKAEYSDGSYVSEKIYVRGGDRRQYFRYTIPKGASAVITHGGKSRTYRAGASADIYVGDSIVFSFDADRETGIPKTKVNGVMKQLIPYRIKTGSDKQDIGFYADTDTESAAFSVYLARPDAARVRISKHIRTLAGDSAPEEGISFRVWSTDYPDFDQALSASGGQQRYAEELVTDSAGKALSSDLAPGTYYVEQVNTRPGFGMMEPNPQQVTAAADETAVLEAEDPEKGIRIWIEKTDWDSGDRISSSSALFGIYADQDCETLVTQCAVAISGEDAGTACTGPLPEGTYYIRELQPPQGYMRSEEIRKVDLRYSRETEDGEGGYLYRISGWENARPEYHDVVVRKSSSEGDRTEFPFHVRIENISESHQVKIMKVSPQGEEGEIAFSIEGGTAEADLQVESGGSIRLDHLPVGASYMIREEGCEGYRPSYTADPPAAVASVHDSSGRSQALQVQEKIQPQSAVGISGYEICYDWVNSRQVLHSLSIRKTSIGIERNEEDRFAFHVAFSGLGGRKPGYTVCHTDDGSLVSSEPPSLTGEGTAEFDIQLQAGQTLKFTGITPMAEYAITEEASEYAPSYRAEVSRGTIPRESDSAPAGSSLTTGTCIMPAGQEDQEVEFSFVNTAQPDRPTSMLYITKELAEGGEDQTFDFTAEFQDLDPQTSYTLVCDDETREFHSAADGTAAVDFRMGSGSYAQIAGLPEGCSYSVTEKGNEYEPSYIVTRTRGGRQRLIDQGSGSARADLTTSVLGTGEGGEVTDRIEFTNSRRLRSLKLTKTQMGGAASAFPFTARFTGLSGKEYLAVTPGSADAVIRADRGGTITVAISGSTFFAGRSGDLSGIPVKIRRSDGAEKALYTDASGCIQAEEYIGWLMSEGAHRQYTIDFLGTVFDAEW